MGSCEAGVTFPETNSTPSTIQFSALFKIIATIVHTIHCFLSGNQLIMNFIP